MGEQQQPADALGVTTASNVCVPAAIVAEEIEPTAKEFLKIAQPFEKELTQQQPHYPTENGIRRNFIADLFDLRGKKKKINANNNSVSLSDVLSMVKSKSKSKSKSKKSKKSKSSVKVGNLLLLNDPHLEQAEHIATSFGNGRHLRDD